jgi:hypothetical protein
LDRTSIAGLTLSTAVTKTFKDLRSAVASYEIHGAIERPGGNALLAVVHEAIDEFGNSKLLNRVSGFSCLRLAVNFLTIETN